MSLRQRLASLIWATTFVVASLFFADAAFAHAGHKHDRVAASQVSDAHRSDTQRENVTTPAVPEQANLELGAPAPRHLPVQSASGGCTGGCCGNGIGCCGALLGTEPNCLPGDRNRKQLESAAFERRSGIDPDTLPRPPRNLA